MPPASPDLVDGVALAALAGRDADGTVGALDTLLARAVAARLDELRAQPRETRAATLARLSVQVRGVPDPRAALSARARALLAADVPRDVGTAWLADAPPVRRGYRADDGLRHVLRTLATVPTHEDADVARHEIGQGRAAIAIARDTLDREECPSLPEDLGEEDLAAILAVERLPRRNVEPGAATVPKRLLLALLREATSLARGTEVVRATGALFLGATGALGGDARSMRWRETGAELARIHELEEPR